VDLRKVNIGVLRPWIAKKVTEMIKFEDDVVVEYVFGMLEDRDTPVSSYFFMSMSKSRLMARCRIQGRCRSIYLVSWINTELHTLPRVFGTC
jgi:hypothetical protein